MAQKPFWWMRHSRTTVGELNEHDAKRNKRLGLIIDVIFAGVILLLLLLALIERQYMCLVYAWLLAMFRSIVWSRQASMRLVRYRKDYIAAVRTDKPFALSRKYIITQTLLVSSSFHIFWFGTAFFIPLGGTYGWLFTSAASGFIAFVVFKAIIDCWIDMELSRLGFWAMQLAGFIVMTLPGAITALILY